MKNLITVTAAPAGFTADFAKAEATLSEELKKYDVVVTSETLPGSKKLATELNKTAAEIDAARKVKVAEASAPIKEFDAKMKSLVTMCKDGRQKLLDQVQVFEDETRKTITALLSDYRSELFDVLKVSDNFKSARFEDLVVLGNLTKTGKLTTKAREALEQRVSADKENQRTIEQRLLLLENASLRAGLSAPLEEVHVKSFLYADDEVYDRELSNLMDVEIKRQEAANTAALKRQNDAVLMAAKETDFAERPSAEVKPEQVVRKAAPTGKKVHIIQATFEVTIPQSIPVQAVIDKLQAVMIKGGITTLKTINEI